MRYIFEDYTFDTVRRELHRRSDVVAIAPQVFDLLDYLIRNRERVVSKDDLIKAVWNERSVSDAALTTRLNAVRGAIGDSGEEQRLIKTLPRKGFRFVGAVRETEKSPATSVATIQDQQSQSNLARPEGPPRLSIIVLPFANIGGDPEQEYFVDGVTESLITDLSRISGSFVIGRHTAFTYKREAVDLRQVGRELNIRYVLEGSVQRGGNRIRVNVQLVDAETGNHLWAERFDKPIADLFEMQDEIVSRLANTLNTQLVEVEARRAEGSLHPDAMDLNFQGLACLNKAFTSDDFTRARAFFERALSINNRNFVALAGMASVDLGMASSLLTDDRASRYSEAETNAIKALSLVPNYAVAHWILGGAYIFTKRAAEGIGKCEQALALNRNLAGAYNSIGSGKYFLGRAAETEAHVLEAFRLSPRDKNAHYWMYSIGRAKIQLGADAEAVDWFRRSIDTNRNFPLAHFMLAGALSALGAVDEARAAVRAGLALSPEFTIRRVLAHRVSDNTTYISTLERLCQGMRMAGVPEG
ncbi:winged helix-turn-helix domain-containing tetratricopeptide repeat protein [Bradyrhizobium sp. USDA 4471]